MYTKLHKKRKKQEQNIKVKGVNFSTTNGGKREDMVGEWQ